MSFSGEVGQVNSVVGGTDITIDESDPNNPIINFDGNVGTVDSITGGTGIGVDNTDPENPIVSVTGNYGQVESISSADSNIIIDNTDPANPIIDFDGDLGTVDEVVAGTGVSVDNTDPERPIISVSGTHGQVDSIVAGTDITVDNTDPENPVISYSGSDEVGAETLQEAYDGSVDGDDSPTIQLTDDANGVVTIKDSSTNDNRDTILEIQANDGSAIFHVDSNSITADTTGDLCSINFMATQDDAEAFIDVYTHTWGAIDRGHVKIGITSNAGVYSGLEIGNSADGEHYFTDGSDSKGIQYAADYSANYVDRSLVDKAYVDGTSLLTSDLTITSDRILTADDAVLDIKSQWGSSEGGRILFEDGYFQFGYASGSSFNSYFKWDVDNGTGWSVKTPINYIADYSSSYTDRSLVDKAYVDSAIGDDDIDVTFTPKATDTYNFSAGTDSVRYENVHLYATTQAGYNVGESSTATGFVNAFMYSDTEPTSEIGILTDSATKYSGLAFNYANGDKHVFTDGLESGGLQYAQDYSANFVDRSLVDKAYVDGVSGGLEDHDIDITEDRVINVDDAVSFSIRNNDNNSVEATTILTFTSVPTTSETLVINGVDIYFPHTLDGGSEHDQVLTSGLTQPIEIASVITEFFNAGVNSVTTDHVKPKAIPVTAVNNYDGTVTLTATEKGEKGNDITTVSNSSFATFTGSTMSGGVGGDFDFIVFQEDEVTVGKPLTYSDDHSAEYGDRSLVDKAYVDGLVYEFGDETIDDITMTFSGDTYNFMIADSAGDEILDVLSTGQVGIGTAADSNSVLKVASESGDTIVNLTSTGDDDVYLKMGVDKVWEFVAWHDNDISGNGEFQFKNITDSQTYLTFEPDSALMTVGQDTKFSGDVTIASGQTLEVKGDTIFDNSPSFPSNVMTDILCPYSLHQDSGLTSIGTALQNVHLRNIDVDHDNYTLSNDTITIASAAHGKYLINFSMVIVDGTAAASSAGTIQASLIIDDASYTHYTVDTRFQETKGDVLLSTTWLVQIATTGSDMTVRFGVRNVGESVSCSQGVTNVSLLKVS